MCRQFSFSFQHKPKNTGPGSGVSALGTPREIRLPCISGGRKHKEIDRNNLVNKAVLIWPNIKNNKDALQIDF
jgi:hypothetical protein